MGFAPVQKGNGLAQRNNGEQLLFFTLILARLSAQTSVTSFQQKWWDRDCAETESEWPWSSLVVPTTSLVCPLLWLLVLCKAQGRTGTGLSAEGWLPKKEEEELRCYLSSSLWYSQQTTSPNGQKTPQVFFLKCINFVFKAEGNFACTSLLPPLFIIFV